MAQGEVDEGLIGEIHAGRDDSPTTAVNGDNITAKSAWRRPRSLLHLSTTSTSTTPPPGSPSVTHSNGSTVPMLPIHFEFNGNSMPRNKLVKRSSSQRALQGSSTMYSTLRRPATSHQRSATLQQHFLEGGNRTPEYSRRAGTPLNDLEEDLYPQGEEEDKSNAAESSDCDWRPFFRRQVRKVRQDDPPRKRRSSFVIHRNEAYRVITPSANDVPTLILGGSVSTQSSDDSMAGPDLPMDDDPQPISPAVFDSERSQALGSPEQNLEVDAEPKARRSFSLGGMFSTPSPTSWRMPRSGSLRKSSLFTPSTSSRRVFSAPQRPKTQGSFDGSLEGPKMSGQRKLHSTEQTFKTRSSFGDHYNRHHQAPNTPPSPHTHRLSAFEFELPGAAPLYPEVAPRSPPDASRGHSSPLSPPSLSPRGSNRVRNQSHRPSGVPSDLASTLIDSENENSRLLSGDEDDQDERSDTIYDSTRTGATGSSHSALKRPAIETIFDESLTINDQLSTSIIGQNTKADRPIQSVERPDSSKVSASCKEEASPAAVPTFKQSETGPTPTTQVTIDFGTAMDQPDALDETNEDWDVETPQTPPSLRLSGARKDLRSISNVPPPVPQITQAMQQLEVSERAKNQDPGPDLPKWLKISDVEKGEASARPKTMSEKHVQDFRGSRLSVRRGTNTMHLRSQSVPVSTNSVDHRHTSNTAKLEAWVLGSKGVSEEWDDDFPEEEDDQPSKPAFTAAHTNHASNASTILVPRSIMERQASVHGQFGHVKELTLLVEELKKLQEQASAQGIMEGQSAELWKEAEGIINLATVDDDRDSPPTRSPRSPSFDFDLSDEESPQSTRRKQPNAHVLKESQHGTTETKSASTTPSRPSPDLANLTPPASTSRPRKESAAKAKSVLENIYQHRSPHSSPLLHATATPEKLPFDTTSLRDLVTRAGVITRALKEVVRRAEESSRNTPDVPPTPPPKDPLPRPDPAFSKIFDQRPPSPPAPTTVPIHSPAPASRSSASPKASISSKTSSSPKKGQHKMSRAASSGSATKSLSKGNKSPKSSRSIHSPSIGSLNSEAAAANSSATTTQKSPRTPRSPRNGKNGSYVGSPGVGGGSIAAGNDNDIKGHMKIMTVV